MKRSAGGPVRRSSEEEAHADGESITENLFRDDGCGLDLRIRSEDVLVLLQCPREIYCVRPLDVADSRRPGRAIPLRGALEALLAASE